MTGFELVLLILGVGLLLLSRLPRRYQVPSHSELYVNHVSRRSPEWLRVCRLARWRAGNRCEHRGLFRCGQRARLSCNHKDYSKLGEEWTCQDPFHCDGRCGGTHGETVEMLCPSHHGRADAKRRRRNGAPRGHRRRRRRRRRIMSL